MPHLLPPALCSINTAAASERCDTRYLVVKPRLFVCKSCFTLSIFASPCFFFLATSFPQHFLPYKHLHEHTSFIHHVLHYLSRAQPSPLVAARARSRKDEALLDTRRLSLYAMRVNGPEDFLNVQERTGRIWRYRIVIVCVFLIEYISPTYELCICFFVSSLLCTP